MKVFVITVTSGNGEQYEDYREITCIVGVYSSLELAESVMCKLPASVPAQSDVVYDWSDEHKMEVPKTDENGMVVYETTIWTTAYYFIHEQDLIESL